MMEIWKLRVDCIEYREIGVIVYEGEGLHARNFLRLAKTILKNDNTKTKRKQKYFKKREINDNET